MMIDDRNGRPVATHITRLQRGTINFEVYSNERIMGEVSPSKILFARSIFRRKISIVLTFLYTIFKNKYF